MKRNTLLTLLAIFGMIAFVLSSCEQASDVAPEGQATLEFSLMETPESAPSNAREKEGDYAHDWEMLPKCGEQAPAAASVIINGQAYKLKPKFFVGLGKYQLQLPLTQPGTYTVEAVTLLNDEDEPIYMAPEEGSPFAAFVAQAVPFKITIVNGEKTINQVELICFCPGDLPEFGINIFEFEKCVIFKNWWFANLCDDYGHSEGNISGGIFIPSTGKKIRGGYAHGFFYTYAKACIGDYNEIIYLILKVENEREKKYYRVPIPAWLLFYLKYSVTHINDDCIGYNVCKLPVATAAAQELGVEGFNPDDYAPEEVDEAFFNDFMAE